MSPRSVATADIVCVKNGKTLLGGKWKGKGCVTGVRAKVRYGFKIDLKFHSDSAN